MHPVFMLKYVTFDIALPCSSMSKLIDLNSVVFVICGYMLLNKSIYITEKVSGIVWEETLDI